MATGWDLHAFIFSLEDLDENEKETCFSKLERQGFADPKKRRAFLALDDADLQAAGISQLSTRKVLRLALAESAAQARPPQDFLQSFKDLLAKGGIQRPDGATLNHIVQHYSNRLMVASTVATALQLYEDVRNMPGTFTEQQIKTQCGLTINGPLFPNLSSSLLGATDAVGFPRVLKMLGRDTFEESACRKLCVGKPEDVPLVEAEVITSRVDHQTAATACHGPGLYTAILMPYHPTALVLMAPLPLCALLAGVKRMVVALEYIHAKGFVHMDVKAANIFVGTDGRWWLGDFGSTVCKDGLITSTTSWFLPTPPTASTRGAPELDWYMLVVAMVIEVLRSQDISWKDKLISQEFCTPWAQLEVTMGDIQRDVPGSSDLLSYLNGLLKRAAGLKPAAAEAAAEEGVGEKGAAEKGAA